jgi:hypothetical protein
MYDGLWYIINVAFILISAAQLGPILTQIYRHSLDIGAVPKDWRNAWVVSIFKKGETHSSKLYESLCNSLACGTLSNALTKSSKMMLTCDPFAKRLTISCTVMTSCDSQDRLYLKPCCDPQHNNWLLF